MSVPSRAARAVRPSLLAVLTAVFVVMSSGPANASAYRFWGYYPMVDGRWTFATTGPAQTTPADGGIEGWRYAVAGMEQPRFPRATPTFDQICGRTPAQEGTKRVGVLVDYGRPGDAAEGAGTPPEPRTACAVVPTDASGSDVLSAVAQARIEGGLACGIDGYPTEGCSEEVATPPPAAASPDESVTPRTDAATRTTQDPSPGATDGGPAQTAERADQGIPPSVWILVGLVLLAVVVALAISIRRRRRAPDRG